MAKTQRVFDDKQIRDPEELKPGMRVVSHHTRSGKSTFFKMASEPFLNEKGRPYVRIKSKLRGETIEKEVSLANMGVVPYENGLWNQHNWLENPNKTPDSTK